MKTTILTSVVALLSLVSSIDLIAQDALPVGTGDRIRVTVLENKIVGILVALVADTLVVMAENDNQPSAVPLAFVKRIEVSRGQKSKVRKGALIGLGVGVAAGATLGAMGGGEVIVNLILFFGGIGAGAGAGIGAAFKGERWKEVPLERVRVGISPRGDGRLMFSASFTF